MLASPQCIPEDFTDEICEFASDFLLTADYRLLREGEVKHWYVWSTFLPYIKLLYLPPSTSGYQEGIENHTYLDPVMNDLRVLSLKTILLALQNMLSRSNHIKVLCQERLEDFVTCAPSYVPLELVPQAEELVRVVGSTGYQVQPPKLLNLVKAKLAAIHFGLEQVMNKSVGELVTQMLC